METTKVLGMEPVHEMGAQWIRLRGAGDDGREVGRG